MRIATTLVLLLIAAQIGLAQRPISVSLDVNVVDGAGAPVRNLSKDDFQVFEDGTQQSIQNFTEIARPHNVLLLIDRSYSMEPHWELLAPAINRFIAQLRPEDRIAVAVFDERGMEMLLDWRTAQTGRVELLAINPNVRGAGGVWGASPATGPTTLKFKTKDFYGALEWAEKRFGVTDGRKSMVVFSDGVQPTTPVKSVSKTLDAAADMDFRKVLKMAREGEVPIFFVGMNTDLNPAGRFPANLYGKIQARLHIELLAGSSGGRAAYPKRPDDVIELYEKIATDFVTSYRLTYVPSNAGRDGKYRRLEVGVRRDGVRVRQSSPGYYAR